MARTAPKSIALRAALAILAAAVAVPGAHAQQILVPSSGYSGYGTGTTSGYTGYGVAVPYGVNTGTGFGGPYGVNTGTGLGGLGNTSTALYPGQPALGASVLGNTYSGQTVLTPPASSGNSGTGTGNSSGTNTQTGAPAAALPEAAGDGTDAKSAKSTPGMTRAKATAAPVAASSAVPAGPMVGDQFRGHPTAVSGDTLSFAGQQVKLTSIRAPELSAVCRSGATAWNCGQDAREALQRLAAARTVTCLVTQAGDMPVASCQSGADDLSGLVVSEGAAFPTDMTYDARMRVARADGRGVWARSAPGR